MSDCEAQEKYLHPIDW